MDYWTDEDVIEDVRVLDFQKTSSIVLTQYTETGVNRRDFGINAELTQEIEDLHDLQDNWDEEGAIAPSEGVVETAIALVTFLGAFGQAVYNVGPGPKGEVLVDLRNEDHSKSLEFLFYNDRSVVVKFFNNEGTQEIFDVKNLFELLQWLNG